MERMGMKMHNARCLVTGGTGFIGSHLVEKLVELQNHVTVLDINLFPRSYFLVRSLDQKTSREKIDARDKKKVFKLIQRFQPHYIFHLAAQAIVEDAYANPLETLDANIMGTCNVLEAARLSKQLQAILFTSSDKAYGKKSTKYVEADPLQGDHPYEVSKSAADLISQSYIKTYNLPVIITRFGNVYGEGDLNFSRIIPGIMEALIKRKTLALRSDGSYTRDYVYVKDIIDGCLTLVEHREKTCGEAYNFGSYETLSVIHVIKTIEQILGKKISYIIQNTSKNEIPTQSLDFSKITKHIAWKPLWTLETSIPTIFNFYQQYYEL